MRSQLLMLIVALGSRRVRERRSVTFRRCACASVRGGGFKPKYCVGTAGAAVLWMAGLAATTLRAASVVR
jgi:hypothetical protein